MYMCNIFYGCLDSLYESNKSKFKKFKKEELFKKKEIRF